MGWPKKGINHQRKPTCKSSSRWSQGSLCYNTHTTANCRNSKCSEHIMDSLSDTPWDFRAKILIKEEAYMLLECSKYFYWCKWMIFSCLKKLFVLSLWPSLVDFAFLSDIKRRINFGRPNGLDRLECWVWAICLDAEGG